MIQFFFDDVDKLLPQIHAALQRADLLKVGSLGHRMKGTISYLAAPCAGSRASRGHVGLFGGEPAEAEEAVRTLDLTAPCPRGSSAAHQSQTARTRPA